MIPETWKKIRQDGLDVLQIDERSLKHGLELHQASYVFDSYGFSPTGGGLDPRVKELISAGASRNEITRAAEEFRMCRCFDDPQMLELLKEAWEFAGVDCNFQNSGLEGISFPEGFKSIGIQAFGGCSALKKNAVSGLINVESIGSGAFVDSGLYAANSSNWDGEPILDEEGATTGYTGGIVMESNKVLLAVNAETSGHYSVNKNVTKVANYAFEGCDKISSLWFSAKLEVLPATALDGLTGLTEIKFEGTEEQWKAIVEASGLSTSVSVSYGVKE